MLLDEKLITQALEDLSRRESGDPVHDTAGGIPVAAVTVQRPRRHLSGALDRRTQSDGTGRIGSGSSSTRLKVGQVCRGILHSGNCWHEVQVEVTLGVKATIRGSAKLFEKLVMEINPPRTGWSGILLCDVLFELYRSCQEKDRSCEGIDSRNWCPWFRTRCPSFWMTLYAFRETELAFATRLSKGTCSSRSGCIFLEQFRSLCSNGRSQIRTVCLIP